MTPGVDPRAVTRQGAIFNPGEGWVDLPSLINVLIEEFSARGGEVVTHAGRASVEVTNGRATGIATADGRRFAADAVLLAAGAAVPKIVAEVGLQIADATPISLLVKTKPIDIALRAVLNTPRVAVRPTPTGSLVLDSAWSEEEVIRRPDGTFEVKDATVHGLLAEASAVLEGILASLSTPMASVRSPFQGTENRCSASYLGSPATTSLSATVEQLGSDRRRAFGG